MLPTFQLALVKLIEMSQADLEERVRDEMVDNEALEERDPSDVDEAPEADAYGDDEYGAGEETGVEAAMADYRTADDVPDYLLARADASEREGTFQISDGQTFYENLQQQIGEYNLSDHERHLMDYLIGSLDEDGFLRKELTTIVDELAVYQYIDTTATELDIQALTIEAKNKLPESLRQKAIWYCNQEVMTLIEKQAINKNNVHLSYGEYFGSKGVPALHGRPIRQCDAILCTETAVK
jgi:RNA polymerase sigma-54 factor